jgi:uncharacterized protein (DUF433 family)
MFKSEQVGHGKFIVSRHADANAHASHCGIDRRFRDKTMFVDKRYSSRREDHESIKMVYSLAASECPSISVNPRVQNGKPCIAGTRIPVHLVLWSVEHKGSIAGALKSYPDLTTQQIKDALYFAEVILGSPNVNSEAATSAR